MKCPYCGYDNPDSSHFCSGCGKNLDEMRAGQDSFRQENGENSRNAGGDTRRIWDGEKDYQEAARQEQTRRAQGTEQERRDEYGDYARRAQGAEQTRRNEYGDHARRAQGAERRNEYGDHARRTESAGRRNDYEEGAGRRSGYDDGARERRQERAMVRQKKEEKKIILIGIILACVVVAAGIGAYFGITYFLDSSGGNTATADSRPGDSSTDSSDEPEATVTPSPTATETPTPTPTATATPTPTPTEEPEQLTVSLVDRNSVSLTGYSKAGVSQAAASSTVVQEGYDNSAAMVVDGDTVTSWQEGVDGDGLGEVLQFELDREYDVKYMTFNLGNWRDPQRYAMNNRPQTMTIWLDDLSFQVTFPDGQTEFCIEFSSDCPASVIYLRIDSVYQGTEWDDTCISEVGIYGK